MSDAIRFQVDLDQRRAADVDDILRSTGMGSKKEVFYNAITLMKWVIQQKKMGKSIAAIDQNGNVTELAMSFFDHVR